MKLYIFDDGVADGWEPFALTRPVSELRFGAWLLRERLERTASRRAAGLLSRPWLRGFTEDGAPPLADPAEIDPSDDRLFLSSRAVPAGHLPATPGPCSYWVAGELAGCLVPAGEEAPDANWFRTPKALAGGEEVELPGRFLGAPWDLVAGNPDRLHADLLEIGSGPTSDLPEGVHRLGAHPVHLGEDVAIEPGVLLDVREGPIRLEARTAVHAGARLEGPIHTGPDCRLLGGAIGALSAGPRSYLRGEIEECIVLGYANKAHDGFLGHAVLGRWVNLGAMTTNSDLKNTYGTIRMGPPGAEVDTGLIKLGCLIGDHAKTGIGLLLNTGSIIGAGSNLFGGEMPPKWVPPFSWGSGSDLVEFREDRFLALAETVMGRRGVEAGETIRDWLAAVWREGRGRPGGKLA